MHRKASLYAAFIISFADGLVLPLVLLTTLHQLHIEQDLLVKITFVFIALFALIMSVSDYFTQKDHQDTDIKTATFQNIGLSKNLEEQLLQDHLREKVEWEKVIEENKNNDIVSHNALIIAFGYLLSGCFLLGCYIFAPVSFNLWTMWIAAFFLVIISAFFKARVTGNAAIRIILTNLIYSTLLSLIAIFVVKKML